MAGSINKVILVGNLGKDPESRQTQSGHTLTRFGLATSERWSDKSGERQERTTGVRHAVVQQCSFTYACLPWPNDLHDLTWHTMGYVMEARRRPAIHWGCYVLRLLDHTSLL